MKKYLIEICIILFMISLAIFAAYLESTNTIIQKSYFSKIQEFPVVSVSKYMKATKRNCFGAVLREELRYRFTYIGNDGRLYEFQDFENTNYGLWKVCVGNQNKYVIKHDTLDIYRYLYLTKETIENMGECDWIK